MLYKNYYPPADSYVLYKSEYALVYQFWQAIELLESEGRINHFDIFCISNNQFGGAKLQAMDKRIGVTKGIADYCCPKVPLFMEAKRVIERDGRLIKTQLKKEQREFMNYCRNNNIAYEVFYNVRQGIEILKHYSIVK